MMENKPEDLKTAIRNYEAGAVDSTCPGELREQYRQIASWLRELQHLRKHSMSLPTSGSIEIHIGDDVEPPDILRAFQYVCEMYGQTVWHDLKQGDFPKPPYDPRGYLCIMNFGDPKDSFYYVFHFLDGFPRPHFSVRPLFMGHKIEITHWTELPKKPEVDGK